jgi:nicotinamide mononucleotide (NMN) deamidase PncC
MIHTATSQRAKAAATTIQTKARAECSCLRKEWAARARFGINRLSNSSVGFSESMSGILGPMGSMQAYSSGDQFWVDHQEPHSDKNHRANKDRNARQT